MVIPAAGLGTRLLPFSKAVPKEMLPVGNKPLIQYAVEEAAASGIEEAILVLPPEGKGAIQNHFRRNLPLERALEQCGRGDEAAALRSLAGICKISIAYQQTPSGLGHAVGCARDLVGDEPFGVLLPDALILSNRPCLRQLVDCYERLPACYIATREVGVEELARFGVLKLSLLDDAQSRGVLYRIGDLVEKPTPERAPSRFGVFGRYVFESAIFDCLARVVPDPSAEIQLTEAISLYCQERAAYGVAFEGDHFDVGNKLGFLQASVAVGLADADTSMQFSRFLQAAVDRQDAARTGACRRT